jgi:short-subunit dehydrogenase
MKALVTGASSGIGRDIAKELAKRGYNLILVSRDNKKLDEVAKEIKNQYEVEAEVIQKDLSIKQNCIDLYNEVKNENIDILINNAGFGVHGPIIETDLDKEINMLETNIIAVHILMKLFLQDMVKNNKGKILNVSSMAAFSPGPLMAGYYSSKAYVYRLSECVKTELKMMKSNVKISVLCPGPVRTNFNKVANVNFAAPSLSSDIVAKYAIKKMLRGKFTIVPGNLMKITRFFEKILPHNWISYVSYIVNYRKSHK